MRISDWSSDVCSSDLDREAVRQGLGHAHGRPRRRSGAGDPDRLAAARQRTGHRRPAAWPRDRGLRPGVLGQDHADLADHRAVPEARWRSDEHTSELQSLMRISYAVFCLKKKNTYKIYTNTPHT